MPKDWQGLDEVPHVQPSEAGGGGKARQNTTSGFEGMSEKNLADSEVLKKGPKIKLDDSESRER